METRAPRALVGIGLLVVIVGVLLGLETTVGGLVVLGGVIVLIAAVERAWKNSHRGPV